MSYNYSTAMFSDSFRCQVLSCGEGKSTKLEDVPKILGLVISQQWVSVISNNSSVTVADV